MYRNVSASLLVGLVVAAVTACGAQTTDSVAPAPESVTESTAESAASEAAPVAQQPPETLQTYDGTTYQYPIKAQYPDTMQVDGGCAGEGCGFFFTFLPQGNALDTAEVHVFLPAGAATAAEIESLVTGPNGLIENAGWTVNSTEADGSQEFPYDWVETVISFSTDQEESGHILLGQTAGQAIQVTLQYPAEMADTYWPAARTVLDSLEFEESLLPLEASGV